MKERPSFPARMPASVSAKIAKPSAVLNLPQGLGMDSSAVRRRMVEKLMAQGLSDLLVQQAMGEVERHRFVDSGLANQAYEDTSLPIGLGQTISKPSVVARMIELLRKGVDLRPLRLATVHLLFGDGMLGFAAGAPYAAIIAAAGGEAIPQAWIDQLAVGGRLIAPVVGRANGQSLVVLDKTAQGVRQTVLEAVHFVPLKSGVA